MGDEAAAVAADVVARQAIAGAKARVGIASRRTGALCRRFRSSRRAPLGVPLPGLLATAALGRPGQRPVLGPPTGCRAAYQAMRCSPSARDDRAGLVGWRTLSPSRLGVRDQIWRLLVSGGDRGQTFCPPPRVWSTGGLRLLALPGGRGPAETSLDPARARHT